MPFSPKIWPKSPKKVGKFGSAIQNYWKIEKSAIRNRIHFIKSILVLVTWKNPLNRDFPLFAIKLYRESTVFMVLERHWHHKRNAFLFVPFWPSKYWSKLRNPSCLAAASQTSLQAMESANASWGSSWTLPQKCFKQKAKVFDVNLNSFRTNSRLSLLTTCFLGNDVTPNFFKLNFRIFKSNPWLLWATRYLGWHLSIHSIREE